MNPYQKLQLTLQAAPKTWLVTGAAGFIGSHLVEALLKLDQLVVGLDNFSTGYQANLDEVKSLVKPEQWARFQFLKGDICKIEDCHSALIWSSVSAPRNQRPVDFVLHQAALGSVPRSIIDPMKTHLSNVDGFLNMALAARDAKVKNFVFAASSATYGDHPDLPKVENKIGKPLSPYAITKLVNELYADVFFKVYGFNSIGLRYFNIFGQRQDPKGAYAAVIPQWTAAVIQGQTVYVNGDGETSRDFCFVENAVQANLLAATASNSSALNQVYNIAVGEQTSLNELYSLISKTLSSYCSLKPTQPAYRDFRQGDVRHSLADINKARNLLGYEPTHNVTQGIEAAMPWYLKKLS
jgi:UDP-N-acetylglucosamine/UDP-N-acetylgalactosamine 4-epimerase